MFGSIQVSPEFRDNLGLPWGSDGKENVWRAFQIAGALGCSEQSVQGWARQGRIPAGRMVNGIRCWTRADMDALAASGVKPIGHYSPITKGERNRLIRSGRSVPKALRKPKKGGAA
jgi:hypothetical protein